MTSLRAVVLACTALACAERGDPSARDDKALVSRFEVATPGYLSIVAAEGAKHAVRVDGVSWGAMPITRREIAVGPHDLEIPTDGGAASYVVDVLPLWETRLTFDEHAWLRRRVERSQDGGALTRRDVLDVQPQSSFPSWRVERFDSAGVSSRKGPEPGEPAVVISVKADEPVAVTIDGNLVPTQNTVVSTAIGSHTVSCVRARAIDTRTFEVGPRGIARIAVRVDHGEIEWSVLDSAALH